MFLGFVRNALFSVHLFFLSVWFWEKYVLYRFMDLEEFQSLSAFGSEKTIMIIAGLS